MLLELSTADEKGIRELVFGTRVTVIRGMGVVV
jgi:hypothetical protein